MWKRIQRFFHAFLLFELLKGMMLTGRYLFARKFTIQYPEENTPQSPRFKGLHAPRRYPNGEERRIACWLCDMISISPSASSTVSARSPVRSIPLSRLAYWNIGIDVSQRQTRLDVSHFSAA